MVVPLLLGILALPAAQPIADVRYDFENSPEKGSLLSFRGGEGARGDSGSLVADGRLSLLEPWWRSWYAAALPAPSGPPAQVAEIEWTSVMGKGSEGIGMVWLPVDRDPSEMAKAVVWEEPSCPGALSLGFDASNPPTQEPFRGSGNIHGRPEHEASLHWDGRERIKRTTKTDFRDMRPHRFRTRIEQVSGGSEVSLWIDRERVFDRHFVADLHPYSGRPVFGGRNGETSGEAFIDDVRIKLGRPADPVPAPRSVVLFDRVLNDKDHHRNESVVSLPENADPYARIVLTLKLEDAPAGIDPWDRLAHLWLLDDRGGKWEVARYITPYRKGWEWKMDVTDLGPLLQGKKRFIQECVTYAEGWLVTAKLDYYPGRRDRIPYRIDRLWSGAPEIGNPDKPVSSFFVPRSLSTDPQTVGAKVRTVVTGHGMLPNSQNAAEFMPIGRTLKVNGRSYRNRLWKTDNYLNPCRPQSGTWKYDRAGWAPGDVVQPWEVDVSHLARGRRTLKAEYALDPYVNEGRGKTWAPFHQTESYLILYRKP
ncbi:MAG TPA: peptide-N-glycosidase F-related protein [Fimbriimonas sp.]